MIFVIIQFGKDIYEEEKNNDFEIKQYQIEKDTGVKKYNKSRTSKLLTIFIFHIDEFIIKLEKEKCRKGESYRVSCLDFLSYLLYEIGTAYERIEESFFRVAIADNTIIRINNKKSADINQLSIPPVKIKYVERKDGKKVIDSYKYEIYSLNNLVDISLYYIHSNRKAILKCLNCGKYFMPSTYSIVKDNDIYNEETTINERLTKLTCSDNCLLKLKRNKSMTNKNKTSKEIKKNIMDKLRNRDLRAKNKGLNSNQLFTFLDKYDEKEMQLKNEYGNNKLKIEIELKKFLEAEDTK